MVIYGQFDPWIVSALIDSHRFIGRFDHWSFRTSTEPKSFRHSVFFAHSRVKSVNSRTVTEAEPGSF